MNSEVQSFKKSTALCVRFNLWITILPLLSPSEISFPAPQSKTEVPNLQKLYVIHFGTQCILVLELLFALQEGVEIANFCARCCISTQLGDRLASQKKNNALLVSIWLCGINEQQPFSQLSQLAQNLIADNEGNYSCVFLFPLTRLGKGKRLLLISPYKSLRRKIQTNGIASHWLLHFVIKCIHGHSYWVFF